MGGGGQFASFGARSKQRLLGRRSALALLTMPLFARSAFAAPAVERAWLGVQMAAAPDGVLVRRVAEPSPAHDAALVHGDVLVALDGVRLSQARQLADAVARFQPRSEERRVGKECRL